MICPFCRQSEIPDKSETTICPSCKTVFDIDDRGECVLVDTDSPRMPMLGQVCAECGLIQQGKRDLCVYCGTIFNKAVH